MDVVHEETGFWHHTTKWGTFRIVSREGRFSAIYEEDDLGWYDSPQQAVDDLVGGHTFSTLNDVDTSQCGLPQALEDWSFVRIQR
jgi:hypothetical protein